MGRKLTLDVDTLRVASFEVASEGAPLGTVNAREDAMAGVTKTNCFTTPCCPVTLTCTPA
jgi:hypothetical protein